MVKISDVEKRSRAARHFIKPGDTLISVNGFEIEDVLDYRFRMMSERVTLLIGHNGRERRVHISKPEDETDIGLCFETALMDEKHSCRNKCIFCFIDQNPAGMRESIYFKDDDSRLSFLHGNYITMTNLTEHEVQRIIEMHISPVNISVHTTDPSLRCSMMNNRFAGDSLKYLRMFADAGIRICAQIVLCRGINDGDALGRTMRDLTEYYPALDSVSVVPAGLTKHRDGLYPLSPFTPGECAAVIEQVTSFGDECAEKYGQRLFYAADEFYVKGKIPLPDEDFYGDFSQIEDGIGMLTSFDAEVRRELEDISHAPKGTPERRVSVVTGFAALDEITKCARLCESVYGALKVNVIGIRNDFFGESVTVAGLLTGGDIAAQAAGQDLGECLYFPRCALRADGDVFLDDMTPEELSRKLGVPCEPSVSDGGSFVHLLTGV